MTAHAPPTDCWAKASREFHGCAVVQESIALLEYKEQGAHDTVASIHTVLLHHVSEQFLDVAFPACLRHPT